MVVELLKRIERSERELEDREHETVSGSARLFIGGKVV